MDLILWRHADARDTAPGQCDADRPLTGKGERQAQRVAQWLNHQLPETTRVLVSPALRTRQTAEALGRKFKLVPALAPGGTVAALLHSVRWPDAREPVLVVGHQDTLGLAAAYLMAGLTAPWPIRKGAVWWLRWRERDGAGQVLLHAVVAPERV